MLLVLWEHVAFVWFLLFVRHGCIRCNISSIMLEMDRILRPGGRAYIRDSLAIMDELQEIAKAIGWHVTSRETSEGPHASFRVLVGDKRLLRAWSNDVYRRTYWFFPLIFPKGNIISTVTLNLRSTQTLLQFHPFFSTQASAGECICRGAFLCWLLTFDTQCSWID